MASRRRRAWAAATPGEALPADDPRLGLGSSDIRAGAGRSAFGANRYCTATEREMKQEAAREAAKEVWLWVRNFAQTFT